MNILDPGRWKPTHSPTREELMIKHRISFQTAHDVWFVGSGAGFLRHSFVPYDILGAAV